MGNNNALRCMYVYVDCLSNKLNKSKSVLKPDVVAITKIFSKHFYNDKPTEALQIAGYDLYCSDSSSGRGVCFYCKSSLRATLCTNIKSKFNKVL